MPRKALRILGGTARGRPLTVGQSRARPPLALAREALFNILADRLPHARVLDLYAGSGTLGLEALSRGAAWCVFVERDPAAIEALVANLDRCGFTRRAEVHTAAAEDAFAGLAGPFDLVFVDPPYATARAWAKGQGGEAVRTETAKRVAAGGRLVLRLEKDDPPPPDWAGLQRTEARVYGRSCVVFYARAGSDRRESRE